MSPYSVPRVRVVGQPRGALLRGSGVHPRPPSRAERVLSSLIHYFSTLLLLSSLPACPVQDAPPGSHAPVTPVALTAPQTLC